MNIYPSYTLAFLRYRQSISGKDRVMEGLSRTRFKENHLNFNRKISYYVLNKYKLNKSFAWKIQNFSKLTLKRFDTMRDVFFAWQFLKIAQNTISMSKKRQNYDQL